MTEEQQETIVNQALRIFCNYLNGWWNSESINKDKKDPYTPENFTTADPDNGLYGETNWNVLMDVNEEFAFPEGLIYIRTTDGDEGGGNTLWVGLEGDFPHAPNGKVGISISWIAHTFDLSTFMIYTDAEGMRTPPDGKMVKNV